MREVSTTVVDVRAEHIRSYYGFRRRRAHWAGGAAAGLAREREVLDLLGDHLTHEQIGQRLFISIADRREPRGRAAPQARRTRSPRPGPVRRWHNDAAVPGRRPPQPLTAFVGREMELAELTRDAQARPPGQRGRPGRGGQDAARVGGRNRLRIGRRGWFDLVPVADAATLEDGLVHACGAQPSSRRRPLRCGRRRAARATRAARARQRRAPRQRRRGARGTAAQRPARADRARDQPDPPRAAVRTRPCHHRAAPSTTRCSCSSTAPLPPAPRCRAQADQVRIAAICSALGGLAARRRACRGARAVPRPRWGRARPARSAGCC